MIFRTFLILSLFLCLVPEAKSAVLDSESITRQIKKDIINQIKQVHDGKTEVEITALPYQTIEVPDGEVEIKSEIDLNNLNSLIIAKVNIYVDSVKIKTFGARVETKIYEKVWVSKDWIKRGDTLKGLRLEEKEISGLSDEVAKKEFKPGKYFARRNIKAGEIINLNYVEEIPTIVKNSPVSLIFKTPLVSITIPAIAAESGKIGDYIKVKNKEYRKSYVGKIIGENIVLVHI